VPKRRFSAEPHAPKYQQVFEALSRDILSRKYEPGQKLPSEAALVQQFRTSRITIGRAMRTLVERGLVERIAGSGTYVRAARHGKHSLVFGLLIPELDNTEIFDPICRGIAAAPQAGEHSLLWGQVAGDETSPTTNALQLCDQYIRKKVAGVFFAPVEASEAARETNLLIVSRLEEARIPIILLDRCVMPYPHRIRHDLVGIDNRRAGFLAADHLLKLGLRCVSLLAHSWSTSTVDARITGYREALLANRLRLEDGAIHRVATIDETSARPLLPEKKKGHVGIVCVNDRTAGELMHVVLGLGYRIPDDIAIVGIDDVEFASLLPVPLTTVHQPCREIGEAAMAAMIERVKRPAMFIRDILVECKLIVRASCGAPGRSPDPTGPVGRASCITLPQIL
jgi:GntR family transcriptional regulator of arabinose operon